MNELDYLIQTGQQQGNNKHFQNFLKIHSKVLKLEKENADLKWMVNDKERELILRGSKITKLESQVSKLKNELTYLEQALTTTQEINDNLTKQLGEKF